MPATFTFSSHLLFLVAQSHFCFFQNRHAITIFDSKGRSFHVLIILPYKLTHMEKLVKLILSAQYKKMLHRAFYLTARLTIKNISSQLMAPTRGGYLYLFVLYGES